MILEMNKVLTNGSVQGRTKYFIAVYFSDIVSFLQEWLIGVPQMEAAFTLSD